MFNSNNKLLTIEVQLKNVKLETLCNVLVYNRSSLKQVIGFQSSPQNLQSSPEQFFKCINDNKDPNNWTLDGKGTFKGMPKMVILNLLLSWKIYHNKILKKMNFCNLYSRGYLSKKTKPRKKRNFGWWFSKTFPCPSHVFN